MSALPTGPYKVIYADPPWRYNFSRSKSRKIENQYPTMSLHDIAQLPVHEIAAADAVLFLWATAPKLPEALHVMEEWGFEYKTNMVWDKELIGMGYYWRGRHEHLLLGTRGRPGVPKPERRSSSVLSFRRTRHSAKPFEIREMIDVMYPEGDRIELFARAHPHNLLWDTWGDEA